MCYELRVVLGVESVNNAYQMRPAPRSVALSRCDPFPPVDGFAVGGHSIEKVSDDLDMRSATTGPAEFPQLAGGLVIAVNGLVNGVGVDFAGAVAVDRRRDVFDEIGQSRLVIGGYPFARCPAFGLRPHGGTIPTWPRRCRT